MTSPQQERPRPRPAPLSLRYRASLLYEGRRRTVLTEPLDAMRRAGLQPVVDPHHRHARSRSGAGITIEAGFANSFRIFGALIDTLWTGRNEGIRRPRSVLGYRFGRNCRFVPRTRSEDARRWAERLSADPGLRQLIARSELKDLHVEESPRGRTVQLQPMAGTITALYFPPLPPYTVLLHADETDAQLELLTHLLTRP